MQRCGIPRLSIGYIHVSLQVRGELSLDASDVFVTNELLPVTNITIEHSSYRETFC